MFQSGSDRQVLDNRGTNVRGEVRFSAPAKPHTLLHYVNLSSSPLISWFSRELARERDFGMRETSYGRDDPIVGELFQDQV